MWLALKDRDCQTWAHSAPILHFCLPCGHWIWGDNHWLSILSNFSIRKRDLLLQELTPPLWDMHFLFSPESELALRQNYSVQVVICIHISCNLEIHLWATVLANQTKGIKILKNQWQVFIKVKSFPCILAYVPSSLSCFRIKTWPPVAPDERGKNMRTKI